MHCRICNKEVSFISGISDHNMKGLNGEDLLIKNLPFQRCPSCGADVYDGRALNILSYANENGINIFDFNDFSIIPKESRNNAIPPESTDNIIKG